MHIINNWKNNLLKKRRKKKENTTTQIGTNVRAQGCKAGLVARNQFASGRSCDRLTWSKFSMAFLGPRANGELVPKFHVALHASHAALPMVTLKISPYTNVTLTFDFDYGLDHPVHGRYPDTKTNWPTDRRSHWTCVIALQITDPSSRQRGHATPTNPQLSKMIKERRGKNWSQVPDGCLAPIRTDRLTIGRNVTLTLTLSRS
jgi:hypothetical protein